MTIEWIKSFDVTRKRDYWYNNVNTDVTFHEPRTNFAHENSIVGFRVKIYWIVQVGYEVRIVVDRNLPHLKS